MSSEKKLNFQEAVKQRLAEKKQQQANGKFSTNPVKSTKQMKSQQTKKANNQHRRTGV
ncbi:hypothetical protein [Fictibacillus enclensis]|uniref:hypothetical protein n=1 Tax=Fictibacillus enclensis TaxID=1017270 RepID=UPI0024BF3A2B|nr:hypothetical protein [Fictibacillus enclensis]WHY74250.1 hypothetical protein QNH15_10210 [Fictibacillus enclensis]